MMQKYTKSWLCPKKDDMNIDHQTHNDINIDNSVVITTSSFLLFHKHLFCILVSYYILYLLINLRLSIFELLIKSQKYTLQPIKKQPAQNKRTIQLFDECLMYPLSNSELFKNLDFLCDDKMDTIVENIITTIIFFIY